MIFESYLMTTVYLGLVMWLQGVDKLRQVVSTAMAGSKGVSPAVIILALAYCINAVTREMQMAEYVADVARPWLSSALLPAVAFVGGPPAGPATV
jgi:Na+/H+ antiporter NhaC